MVAVLNPVSLTIVFVLLAAAIVVLAIPFLMPPDLLLLIFALFLRQNPQGLALVKRLELLG
jgi:hypothetical protein